MSQINLPGISSVNPADEPKQAPPTRIPKAPKEPKGGWWWGTGRRKRAVARVRLRPVQGGSSPTVRVQTGADTFKTIEEYFTEERDRNDCYAPLKATDTLSRMDVVVRAQGGGFMGQAQAVRLGISRALVGFDPAMEDTLRNNGFLTRDAREVERKKYGQAGARRRFQFSKR